MILCNIFAPVPTGIIFCWCFSEAIDTLEVMIEVLDLLEERMTWLYAIITNVRRTGSEDPYYCSEERSVHASAVYRTP